MKVDPKDIGISFGRGLAQRTLARHHYLGAPTIGRSIICFCFHLPGGLLGNRGPIVAASTWGSPTGRWKEGPPLELTRMVVVPGYEVNCSTLMSMMVNHLKTIVKTYQNSLLISYADPEYGHHGGIYQASSWFYNGPTSSKGRRFRRIDDHDIIMHPRKAGHLYGSASLETLKRKTGEEWEAIMLEPKHLYWKPLNSKGRAMAKKLGLVHKPYPKPDIEE